VREQTLIQVLERLPEVLRRHVRPQREARQLMSFPVKSVTRKTTVAEVRETLTRYNINALPVLDRRRVVGIITRQVADKAAHHGLADLPVSECMSGEFTVVAPETPIESVQELIVERNQRFVPVVENGRLVGAITRTDMLRYLVEGARVAQTALAGDSAESPTLKKRQVARLLREQLPSPILTMLQAMGKVGDDLGLGVFIVGGFVRDLLLRQRNLDLDLVVEGDGIALPPSTPTAMAAGSAPIGNSALQSSFIPTASRWMSPQHGWSTTSSRGRCPRSSMPQSSSISTAGILPSTPWRWPLIIASSVNCWISSADSAICGRRQSGSCTI
jgi:CBS domain-containing protein